MTCATPAEGIAFRIVDGRIAALGRLADSDAHRVIYRHIMQLGGDFILDRATRITVGGKK
jgi:hypothetical protein